MLSCLFEMILALLISGATINSTDLNFVSYQPLTFLAICLLTQTSISQD